MNIPLFKVNTHSSYTIGNKIKELFDSGFIGQGSKVDEFEEKLAEKLKHPYIATTNAATSAEHLAIHLLKQPKQYFLHEFNTIAESYWPGLNYRDEVLLCPLTCFATTTPILANGLVPKWVDVDPNTLSISLEDLEKKITEKTKIIIPVHWGGTPVDLDKLKDIVLDARQKIGFRPAVIEDCAHAWGAKYKGKALGTHGNMAFYSFQAIKHLTTGDGGLLCLPHQDLYRRAKLLRWYGIDRETPRADFRCENDIEEWGFKFHMNDIAATIGLSNLYGSDYIVKSCRNNAASYDVLLKDIDGIELLQFPEYCESSYWLYTIKVKNRNKLMEKLASFGIMSSRVHERNDKHSCVAKFRTELPNLDKAVEEMLCLPVGPWVTAENIKDIVKIIRSGW